MSLVLHGEQANSQTHMVNEKVHHDFKSNRKALFYYERDIKTHRSIKRAVGEFEDNSKWSRKSPCFLNGKINAMIGPNRITSY